MVVVGLNGFGKFLGEGLSSAGSSEAISEEGGGRVEAKSQFKLGRLCAGNEAISRRQDFVLTWGHQKRNYSIIIQLNLLLRVTVLTILAVTLPGNCNSRTLMLTLPAKGGCNNPRGILQ